MIHTHSVENFNKKRLIIKKIKYILTLENFKKSKINENSISFMDDNEGEIIKDPSFYSEESLEHILHVIIDIKSDDITNTKLYDDNVEIEIGDQKLIFGYSDVKNGWTGSYHVNDEIKANKYMNSDEFIEGLKNLLLYL